MKSYLGLCHHLRREPTEEEIRTYIEQQSGLIEARPDCFVCDKPFEGVSADVNPLPNGRYLFSLASTCLDHNDTTMIDFDAKSQDFLRRGGELTRIPSWAVVGGDHKVYIGAALFLPRRVTDRELKYYILGTGVPTEEPLCLLCNKVATKVYASNNPEKGNRWTLGLASLCIAHDRNDPKVGEAATRKMRKLGDETPEAITPIFENEILRTSFPFDDSQKTTGIAIDLKTLLDGHHRWIH